jgi:hypothetical protein
MIWIEFHDRISIGNGFVRIGGDRAHVDVIGEKFLGFVGGHRELLLFGVRRLVDALKKR